MPLTVAEADHLLVDLLSAVIRSMRNFIMLAIGVPALMALFIYTSCIS
ncbi:hypothetical protein ACFP7A_06945 [Sporolactobacillus kofuensis]|uniref:Uncharacterized protein n=1 Tax=Sporolactobacillus kofuensis TaxID=269672 RepID=A0ABW1WD77_9BACL|nr:hypothetical protein [Sporolactobacillus kofuensis]MCO7175357.1 hypothetical protein [Sporolactobacillus kofuensis]